MNLRPLAALLALSASAAAQAPAPLAAARPPRPKLPALATPAPGAFLGGTDECTTQHASAGVGDVYGVPFATGSTGAEGQNEARCYAFGTTGIDADVWFDWTADQDGEARLSTCLTTLVDTKVAVWRYVGTTQCPPDGTSLACSDDACGAQARAAWHVRLGETYTLQVGTFPGAAGGAGSFSIEIGATFECGRYDDGQCENALGLVPGGEIGWLHQYSCLFAVDVVHTAYGAAIWPGSVANGSAARVALYDELDGNGDPNDGLAVRFVAPTLVTNACTDLFSAVPVDPPVTGADYLLATASHAPGEFPAPMDEDHPVDEAWVVGSTTGPGSLDLGDLSNNTLPPTRLATTGFNAAWLLRGGSDEDCELCPVSSYCFAAGSGTPCPCGNDTGGATGCANSSGLGALLEASGTPSLAADNFVLRALNAVPAQPGLFFQGRMAIEVPFGDGLRCAGQDVVRLVVVTPDAGGCAASDGSCGAVVGGTPGPISQHPDNPGLVPGDQRYYQFWYRDPAGPCGSGFNLSNGIAALWI